MMEPDYIILNKINFSVFKKIIKTHKLVDPVSKIILNS
jgi:hypothetical protein